MPLKHLIKKYSIWMILSYIFIGFIIYGFILIPQGKILQEYKTKKSRIEYTYMKVTTTPTFLNSIESTVRVGHEKLTDFLWLDLTEIDPGLALYNYLYNLTKYRGIEIIEITKEESTAGRMTKEDQLYYKWKVKITGRFPEVVSFINDIEQNNKFLIVKEISVTKERELISNNILVIYEMRIFGIKKEALDEKKGENE
ncbi:MAG: hypothetical protein N3D17_02360 [bacterium]|nr:hypothetical protein [bacterium]